MNRFLPKQPDPYLKKTADMTPARFGHLNALIQDIEEELANFQPADPTVFDPTQFSGAGTENDPKTVQLKTINGTSIHGTGDLVISGEVVDLTPYTQKGGYNGTTEDLHNELNLIYDTAVLGNPVEGNTIDSFAGTMSSISSTEHAIMTTPVPIDGKVTEVQLRSNQASNTVYISLWDWNGISGAGAVYTMIEEKSFTKTSSTDVQTIDISALNFNVTAGKYVGFRGGRFIAAIGQNEFLYTVNNSLYQGLLFKYTIQSPVSVAIADISTINSNVDSIDQKMKDVKSSRYVNAYTSTDFSDWTLTAASASGTDLTISNAGAVADHTLMFACNKRKFSFEFTPNNLGAIQVNFIGLDGQSLFIINFGTNTFRFNGNTVSEHSTIPFVAGRKYRCEIWFYERNWYVTIEDFASLEKTEIYVDAQASNVNGAMQEYAQFSRVSGSTTIHKVSVDVISGVDILFVGDSITADIWRIPNRGNWSTIVGDKIGNCSILGLPGRGAAYITNFYHEIEAIKPKYISYSLGVNGGVNATHINNFLDYCETNGFIPIVNHVICTKANNHVTYNAAIDSVLTGTNRSFMGAYMDFATAKENNPIGPIMGTDWGADNRSNPALYPTSSGEAADVHPNAAGHAAMAVRFLRDIKI